MKNGMTFEQYDMACNYIAELIGNEEIALDVVNNICKIFNLEPTETEEEFMEKALAVLFEV